MKEAFIFDKVDLESTVKCHTVNILSLQFLYYEKETWNTKGIERERAISFFFISIMSSENILIIG